MEEQMEYLEIERLGKQQQERERKRRKEKNTRGGKRRGNLKNESELINTGTLARKEKQT